MLVAAQHLIPPTHRSYIDAPATLHTPQQQLHFEALDALSSSSPNRPIATHASEEEMQLVTQLAHLASQHHASEYNRLKFGPRGAPITYIPLTLQLPEHVKELQARQVTHTKRQAWWPSDEKVKNLDRRWAQNGGTAARQSFPMRRDSSLSDPKQSAPPIPTSTALPEEAMNLQQELSAAISSPLQMVYPDLNHVHQTKTSETHPINISMMVPFELLPIISSHLTSASQPSPIMFHVPSCYLLDRFITIPPAGNQTMLKTQHTSNNLVRLIPAAVRNSPPSERMSPLLQSRLPVPSIMWGQPSGSDALQAAINGRSSLDPSTVAATAVKPTETLPPLPAFTVPSQTPTEGLMTDSPPVPVGTLPSIPVSESMPQLAPTGVARRPLKLKRATSAPPVLSLFKPLHSKLSRPEVKPLTRSSLLLDNCIADPSKSPAPSLTLSASTSSSSTSSYPLSSNAWMSHHPPSTNPGESTGPRMPSFSPILSPFQTFSGPLPAHPRLGNLFLSSCPGKKVRLSGPVKGRGAICRDLGQDLRRMKELDVGCIVCCLDDEELDFLGASWPEYSQLAHKLGIDVLRLPTPEGLAPLTPESLDAHLSKLIASYTLRGIPILVHCRGGVGRAGLVACCWILKLGLCGWKTVDPRRPRPMNGEVCRETLQLVEKVIYVVRRRRSLKAVETFEQVKFLVDFVDYLDAVARHCDVGGEID